MISVEDATRVINRTIAEHQALSAVGILVDPLTREDMEAMARWLDFLRLYHIEAEKHDNRKYIF